MAGRHRCADPGARVRHLSATWRRWRPRDGGGAPRGGGGPSATRPPIVRPRRGAPLRAGARANSSADEWPGRVAAAENGRPRPTEWLTDLSGSVSGSDKNLSPQVRAVPGRGPGARAGALIAVLSDRRRRGGRGGCQIGLVALGPSFGPAVAPSSGPLGKRGPRRAPQAPAKAI
jgi:hypothetical protein